MRELGEAAMMGGETLARLRGPEDEEVGGKRGWQHHGPHQGVFNLVFPVFPFL